MTLGRWPAIVGLALLVAGLAYLRDPPWLAGMTSGLGPWTTGADGTRYRWATSHSSFFVPSSATMVRIPIRATFDRAGDWPITAVIAIDDRTADRLTLQDGSWRTIELRLPPRGSRKHRRIDIRLDRTRPDNQGVQIGEPLTR